MMPRFLLGPRRLWWFFTDWTTPIQFHCRCLKCGNPFVIGSHGFRFPRIFEHNPWCEMHRVASLKFPGLWWLCGPCVRMRFWIHRLWIIDRWRFRLKYNWGVGVPDECKSGDHDWDASPNGDYEDSGMRYITGTCKRCGFNHRWEFKA